MFAIGGSASSQTLHTGALAETISRTSSTDAPELSVTHAHVTRRRLLQTSGNTPQTALVFILTFAAQPSQSDAAVETAVQNAVASANTPLTVGTSAVDAGSAAYNVTVLFLLAVRYSQVSCLTQAVLSPAPAMTNGPYHHGRADHVRHTVLVSVTCSLVTVLLLIHAACH